MWYKIIASSPTCLISRLLNPQVWPLIFLTSAHSCRLELTSFAEKKLKTGPVCKNAVTYSRLSIELHIPSDGLLIIIIIIIVIISIGIGISMSKCTCLQTNWSGVLFELRTK